MKSIFAKIYNKLKQFMPSENNSEKRFFTMDIFQNEKYEIGPFTYGHPTILFENEGEI